MIRFRASAPTTVVSCEERLAAGLHHWPDGTMGILRHGARAVALAPNGRRTARHDLTRGGFVAGLVDPAQARTNPAVPADHASGGPVWMDVASGTVVVCYHAEHFTDGDPSDYWSWLGFAATDLDGGPLHDLGPVITSDLPEHSSQRMRPIDVGPGALVEHEGHLLVYFLDRANLHARVNLGVARIPVTEVAAAAHQRRAPSLHKYFAGGFREPGLGGRATDLVPNPRHRLLWIDVARLPARDRLVLVHSTALDHQQGRTKWGLVARSSPDGIGWDEGQVIHEGPYGTELLYVTIDGGGHPDRSIEGGEFDLYVVAATAEHRWDDARLDRLRVRCW